MASLESSLAEVYASLRIETTAKEKYEYASQAYDAAKRERVHAVDALLSAVKTDFEAYARENPHPAYKTIEVHLTTRPSANDTVDVTIVLDKPFMTMKPKLADVTQAYKPFVQQLSGLVLSIKQYVMQLGGYDDEGPYPERLGRPH